MKLLLKNIKGNYNKEEKLEEDNLIIFTDISYKSQSKIQKQKKLNKVYTKKYYYSLKAFTTFLNLHFVH